MNKADVSEGAVHTVQLPHTHSLAEETYRSCQQHMSPSPSTGSCSVCNNPRIKFIHSSNETEENKRSHVT
jgi:hypothetical protein